MIRLLKLDVFRRARTPESDEFADRPTLFPQIPPLSYRRQMNKALDQARAEETGPQGQMRNPLSRDAAMEAVLPRAPAFSLCQDCVPFHPMNLLLEAKADSPDCCND